MKLEQFESFFRTLERPHNQFKLCVEFGHILVKAKDLTAVSYDEENGIKDFLDYLVHLGWEPYYEEGKLVGADHNEKEWVRLGVGGQINWSFKDFIYIRDLDQAYLAFIEGLFEELKRRDEILMATGHQPVSAPSEIKAIPTAHAENIEKYAAGNERLEDYFKGACMSKVSLNFAHVDNFEKRFQAATIIYPALASLFANAAWSKGEKIEGLLYNLNSLTAADGHLYHVDEALHNTFKYDGYAYFLSHAPSIEKRSGEALEFTGDKEVRDAYLEDLDEEQVKAVLNNVHPIVGVTEHGITINNIDSVPYPLNMAYVLLVKALLYNPDHMTAIQKMLEEIKEEKLLESRKEWISKGMKAKIGGGTVFDMIKDLYFMVTLTIEPSEQHYLQPLNSLIFKDLRVSQVTDRQFEKILNAE